MILLLSGAKVLNYCNSKIKDKNKKKIDQSSANDILLRHYVQDSTIRPHIN